MKTLDKKSIKLPYVDSETFRMLMRLGLQYDRQQRKYSAQDLDEERASAVLELLSKILKEQVSFSEEVRPAQAKKAKQTCVRCGTSVQCDECRYFEMCESKDTTSKCICGKCLEERNSMSEP